MLGANETYHELHYAAHERVVVLHTRKEGHLKTMPTYTDMILDRSLLRFIPYTVTPNLVTVFRFIMIPFVLFTLLTGHIFLSFALFAVAAFSDAVDGALARTRHQVTDWGKIYDPLADKLLVGSVAAILVTLYVNPLTALILIGLELILIVVAMWKRTVERKVFQAHWSGKVKMVAQSLALLSLFLYIVTGYHVFIDLGTLLVYAAIAFALISLVVYRSV